MAQKGVVKNGEAFCLECKSSIDREAERCPSCDSLLEEEVKAFSCPRCKTVLPLGTSECQQCGMKFRIKTLKQRLVPWSSQGETVDEVQAAEAAEEGAVGAEELSSEQLDKLQKLVDNMDKLAESRAELMSRMKQRHAEEKLRLTEMRSMSEGPMRLDLVESEVMALAEEIADVVKLHSGMLAIADEISTLVESFDLSDEARTKGLAAKAMRIAAEVGGADASQMKAREDQLAKREEMVDRKIRGYASKRKELEDKEAEIASRGEQLEKDKASFERMRKGDVSAAASEQAEEWRKSEAELAARISSLCSTLCEGADVPGGDADQTVDAGLAAVEDAARKLLSERRDDRAKLEAIEEQESEMRELLKALDQLLGQLPEEAVQQFTQSADYKLYERILDRYKI